LGCSPIREEVFVDRFDNDSEEANLKDSDEELNDDKNLIVSNSRRLPKTYG
jgi:hypothetical protein